MDAMRTDAESPSDHMDTSSDLRAVTPFAYVPSGMGVASPNKSDFGGETTSDTHETSCTVAKTWVRSFWRLFFSLPSEVRTKIYRHILPGPQHPLFSPHSTWRVPIPPILQVCRGMRIEALPLYYQTFQVAGPDVEDLVPWLQTIGPDARMSLQSVCVKWDYGDPTRQTRQKQKNRFWLEFKAFGAEIRKPALKVIELE